MKHVCCAPYHPASNGLAKRFIRMFKEAMKAGNATAKSDHKKLLNFLLRYRATPHPTTGRTPASLFLNRDLRMRLNLLKLIVKNKCSTASPRTLIEMDML